MISKIRHKTQCYKEELDHLLHSQTAPLCLCDLQWLYQTAIAPTILLLPPPVNIIPYLGIHRQFPSQSSP